MADIDVTEIKKWLQSGEITELAKGFGISRRSAYRHLSPSSKKRNLKFIAKCTERAIANKATSVNGINRLKSLNTAL